MKMNQEREKKKQDGLKSCSQQRWKRRERAIRRCIDPNFLPQHSSTLILPSLPATFHSWDHGSVTDNNCVCVDCFETHNQPFPILYQTECNFWIFMKTDEMCLNRSSKWPRHEEVRKKGLKGSKGYRTCIKMFILVNFSVNTSCEYRWTRLVVLTVPRKTKKKRLEGFGKHLAAALVEKCYLVIWD